MKVYLATAMSSRTGLELVCQSVHNLTVLDSYGIEGICPIQEEQIRPVDAYLFASREVMTTFWPRDKELIREANVIFDVTPDRKTFGVEHELGVARYCYFKPVVRIFPKGKIPHDGNVVFFEDDIVTDSLEDACEKALKLWGTYPKRLKWRLKMLFRSMPRWIAFQVRFLFQ